MRGIERTFGVCRQTLSAWLKKGGTAPPLETTLKSVDPRKTPVLEADGVWSFVFCSHTKVWLWIALSQETREVVAYAFGDRKALVFTDYWKAYPPVIPPEQHRPVGQETGETAHIERWNNTLRQHLGCFMRKTLSFSKCFSMHEICLKLFLHRYNTELLPSFGYDSI